MQGGAYVVETNTRIDAGPTWRGLFNATPVIFDDDGTTQVLADDGVSPVYWTGQDQMTTPQMLSQLNVARNAKATGLVGAGSNRAGATALTADINVFSTVTTGQGAVLSGTKDQIILNGGAGVLTVYAPGSITIDGTAGSTGVPLTNALRCIYYLTSPTTYVSAQLGAVSA